ncbi:hypothetical protein ABZ957_03535 [Streptomyces sp. NPDC046316]|uniref:hypothetical protein n=1 Tax=Streptomyces sp. NPDC046316 TaxID=3154494 RepID=UPI0033CEE434
MRQEIQHDRADAPAPGVEVQFAGLLLHACDAFEEQAEAAAEHDISEALALRHHPGNVALADLTDRLISRCDGLSGGIEGIRESERSVRASGVLETWEKLRTDGPEDGPLGTWSYTRQLALTARDMVRVLREHRAAQRHAIAPFVGRPGLPPLAPDAL